MSKKNENQVEMTIDEFGNANEAYYDDQTSNADYANEAPAMTDAEVKKEITRMNRKFVNEFKSEIKTVIIALNRAVSLDELHEAIEFFADTSVDVKLVKRAIRALIKEEKLTEISKNTFELSQRKRDFYSALANLKKNPTQRLS